MIFMKGMEQSVSHTWDHCAGETAKKHFDIMVGEYYFEGLSNHNNEIFTYITIALAKLPRSTLTSWFENIILKLWQ